MHRLPKATRPTDWGRCNFPDWQRIVRDAYKSRTEVRTTQSQYGGQAGYFDRRRTAKSPAGVRPKPPNHDSCGSEYGVRLMEDPNEIDRLLCPLRPVHEAIPAHPLKAAGDPSVVEAMQLAIG